MAGRAELPELLRPPAHRGPLIAAGAVLFTLGIALEEQRLDEVLPQVIHVLIVAAIALGIAVLAAANWILDADSQAVYRWLLLALAIAFASASLVLRGARPRHAELTVITAGLATLAIALVASVGVLLGSLSVFGAGGSGGGFLPGFWELVVLGAGCGLIAYGAVDRVPGAAWLGIVHLLAFLAAASAGADDTLLWWPLVLLVLGAGMLAAGLRPRSPLSPEPDAYAVDRPLASRADAEVILTVRNDDPPPRLGSVP